MALGEVVNPRMNDGDLDRVPGAGAPNFGVEPGEIGRRILRLRRHHLVIWERIREDSGTQEPGRTERMGFVRVFEHKNWVG